MPPAAAIIGGAVIGAGASIYSANRASSAQESAAQSANATQWEMYKQSRADQLPWLQAGQKALGKLPSMILQGPGNFYASPGYQFNLAEGQKAIDRYNASRGLYASGKASKDLARFSQGLASNEYQNFVNNWIQTKLNPTQSLAQVGQTSAIGLGNQANYTAAQMGQNLQNAGNARATGYINQSNAINQGLQGISDYYTMQQMMEKTPYGTPLWTQSPYISGTGWHGLGEGQYGSMY